MRENNEVVSSMKENKAIENQGPQPKGLDQQSLVERLRIRAHIRRNSQGRKLVQEGKPDRIADLLEQAADRIESFEGMFETAKIGAFSKHSEYDAVVVDFDKYYRMVDLLAEQQEDIQHMQGVIERLHDALETEEGRLEFMKKRDARDDEFFEWGR